MEEVSKRWHVYHLMVAEGSHARSNGPEVKAAWGKVLGQRAVWLTDHRQMAQVIVSLLQMAQGMDSERVAKSWNAATAKVIRAMDLTGVHVA